jgi:hypothetical protein
MTAILTPSKTNRSRESTPIEDTLKTSSPIKKASVLVSTPSKAIVAPALPRLTIYKIVLVNFKSCKLALSSLLQADARWKQHRRGHGRDWTF